VVTAFDKPLSIEEVPVPEATVAFPIIAYLAAKQKAETLFASRDIVRELERLAHPK
jgi:hypothetical protein